MLAVFSDIRDITNLSCIIRLLTAFFCGGLIGLERSYKNRPAGFRTHILVCLAATMASMTGIYLYLNLHLPKDISRIGAQVVSGLGFLGAGTIFVTKKLTVKGLTTAAGLWVSGVIGLAIGGGYYEGALLGTAAVLVTEIWFSRLTLQIRHSEIFRVQVCYHDKPALDQVMRLCKDYRLAIENLHVTSDSANAAPEYLAVLTLRPRVTTLWAKPFKKDVLLLTLRQIPGVLDINDLGPLD